MAHRNRQSNPTFEVCCACFLVSALCCVSISVLNPMTHLRLLIAGLCGSLFAFCSLADAQQPRKVPRIGYLSSFDPASESDRAEPIWLALRELGYIEGQNIAFEYRYAEGKLDRFPELAAELVRLKVDMILEPIEI